MKQSLNNEKKRKKPCGCVGKTFRAGELSSGRPRREGQVWHVCGTVMQPVWLGLFEERIMQTIKRIVGGQ
jgi:hypothetical protein